MKRLLTILILGTFTLVARAELIDRGGGFIYDDVLDITWTQYAGLMNTPRNQGAAANWAAMLSVYDPVRGITLDNWRLPSMDRDRDGTIVNCSLTTEQECRDNEYGYLFHQYGVTESDPSPFDKPLVDGFGGGVWHSTTPGTMCCNEAWWAFSFASGDQWQVYAWNVSFGWAVMDGDVGPAPPLVTCVGFDPPLSNGPVSVKKNRVLPHKAILLDDAGQPIDDLGFTAPPVIEVLFNSSVDAIAQDVSSEALANGAGAEGNQFEFVDSKWQFNLSTKSYSAAGTYTVTMKSGDSSEYRIDPTCSSQFVVR